MKQYIVNAFTGEPFSGNPAAVCVMERWPSDESMMKLAMENNLSENEVDCIRMFYEVVGIRKFWMLERVL